MTIDEDRKNTWNRRPTNNSSGHNENGKKSPENINQFSIRSDEGMEKTTKSGATQMETKNLENAKQPSFLETFLCEKCKN